jgi:hypothetical protein
VSPKQNDFDDSPSGAHRVYSDGTVYRQGKDDEWYPVDDTNNKDVAVSDTEHAVHGLRALFRLAMKSRNEVALAAFVGLLTGGGSGAITGSVESESISRREFDLHAQEQLRALNVITDDLNAIRIDVAALRADVEAHSDLEGHPVGLYRLGALEAQLREAVQAMSELHRSHK